MKSLDKLRKHMDAYCACYEEELIDAIEREHAELMREAIDKAHADGERNAVNQARSASEDYRRGHEDAMKDTKDMRDFCERLEDAAKEREEIEAFGVAYVPLPVDADGVPIHIGDVMEGVCKYDTLRKVTGEVITIHCDSMDDGSLSTSVGLRVWTEDSKPYRLTFIDPLASVYRHHHETTMEDMLREFALACEDAGNAGPEVARLSAEYAARLRLVEEEQ